MTGDIKRSWERSWYRRNRDRVLAKRKKRYAENKVYYRAKSRARYAERREEVSRYNKEYRAKNRDRIRAQQRKYAYGINQQQFDRLLKEQTNRCAICRTARPMEFGGRGWHVDHDHRTGRIRGILCNRCNLGLGHFHDRPRLLRRAIKYLEVK